ncbi:MAG: hypothetical protein IJ438_12100 [Clostridia bacterium]|nr:hypothetical protein [Clostridia bacterium]
MQFFVNARNFIYRNARPLELAIWQYHFEGGSAEQVLHALSFYQNEDGGFGHGLEADCWNPHSSPLTTQTATEILYAVDAPREHPVVQGVLRYLDSGRDFDLAHRQWPGSIPSNNDHPRAIWWTYEADKEGFDYNPTAGLAAFILRYAEKGSSVYKKGLTLAQEAINWLLAKEPFAEKHVVYLFLRLAQFAQGHDLTGLDALAARLREQVPLCVCTDLSKYGVEYVDRPTDLIDGPQHPYYPDIAAAADAECQFLLDSQLADGSWPVPWKWWTEYTDEFAVAANWWKSHIIIKHILYLKNFGRC